MRPVIMISGPACNIHRSQNQLLKPIGNSFEVDWIFWPVADAEEGIKCAIVVDSAYMSNSDAISAVYIRKVLVMLWAPDWTAMAFGK